MFRDISCDITSYCWLIKSLLSEADRGTSFQGGLSLIGSVHFKAQNELLIEEQTKMTTELQQRKVMTE